MMVQYVVWTVGDNYLNACEIKSEGWRPGNEARSYLRSERFLKISYAACHKFSLKYFCMRLKIREIKDPRKFSTIRYTCSGQDFDHFQEDKNLESCSTIISTADHYWSCPTKWGKNSKWRY